MLHISEVLNELVQVQRSHGTDASNEDPHWVSALATLHNTDTVIPGSRDGWVRVWRVGEGFRSVKEVHKVEVRGFVNSLAISPSGGWIVAGVGQEVGEGEASSSRGFVLFTIWNCKRKNISFWWSCI